MAAPACLKKKFTEDEKYHNLMRWLISRFLVKSKQSCFRFVVHFDFCSCSGILSLETLSSHKYLYLPKWQYCTKCSIIQQLFTYLCYIFVITTDKKEMHFCGNIIPHLYLSEGNNLTVIIIRQFHLRNRVSSLLASRWELIMHRKFWFFAIQNNVHLI